MRNLSWRKITALTLSAFMLTALAPARADAWGNEGHRIVARIAMGLLTPAAQAEVRNLLGNDRLDNVALFADDIRNAPPPRTRPETKLWHFADIPLGQQFNANARYCNRSPWGDCVVEAIDRFNDVLFNDFRDFPTDRLEYDNSREEALKFIVHFVGDLHQPLHCADKNGDGGGNRRRVRFFNSNTNLHSLWDSGLLNRAMTNDGLGIVAYANRLSAGLTTEQRNFARSTTRVTRAQIIDWTNESHEIARRDVYTGVAESLSVTSTLGQTYFDDNRGNVDDQLKQGGVRLARILNSAFR
jgi:hypothetical protein